MTRQASISISLVPETLCIGAHTVEKDASVLFLGIRGSGKSTLAIIASAALARKVVDTEKAFKENTGLTSTDFKKHHGQAAFAGQQMALLSSLLRQYDKNTIIVSSWLESEAQQLFQEFSKNHAVVHIVREHKQISEHLQITDDSKLTSLLLYTNAIFRRCSTHEFFNISEEDNLSAAGDASILKHKRASTPFLTLKRVERHFLKFLSIILPSGCVPFSESLSPLAHVPVEHRHWTYINSIPLSVLINEGIDVEILETGADAIEILIDSIISDGQLMNDCESQISKVVANIRRDIAIPIIYHISIPLNRSIDNALIARYIALLKHGISLATEYITIDLRLGEKLISQFVSRAGKSTKVIGHAAHLTDPSWSDSLWSVYYNRAVETGCIAVRLTRHAKHIQENFELNYFRASVASLHGSKIPLIAFNTGFKGRQSQCVNHIMTSVSPESLMTESAFVQDTSLTNRRPTITARQATQSLYSSFLKEPMNLYVFGANVDSSMSPAMHNAALQALGIESRYRPYSTRTIQEIQHLATEASFGGASIGLPFKVDAISLTSRLSPHAEAIGAINTLIPIRTTSEGVSTCEKLIIQNCGITGPVLELFGENTDWIGIRACLRRGLSPANAVRQSTSGLVIGAGGMARAAVYAMLQLGVKNIVIFNRTVVHAQQMVRHFSDLQASNSTVLANIDLASTKFRVLSSLGEPWPASEFKPPTLIASCIPTHSNDSTPASLFTLPETWMASTTGGVVIELAYKFLNTPLLKQVRQAAHRGWVAMDGLDLLPEQGFAQFELFTGRRAPRRLMREEMFRAYPEIHGQSSKRQLLPRMEEIVVQEP